MAEGRWHIPRDGSLPCLQTHPPTPSGQQHAAGPNDQEIAWALHTYTMASLLPKRQLSFINGATALVWNPDPKWIRIINNGSSLTCLDTKIIKGIMMDWFVRALLQKRGKQWGWEPQQHDFHTRTSPSHTRDGKKRPAEFLPLSQHQPYRLLLELPVPLLVYRDWPGLKTHQKNKGTRELGQELGKDKQKENGTIAAITNLTSSQLQGKTWPIMAKKWRASWPTSSSLNKNRHHCAPGPHSSSGHLVTGNTLAKIKEHSHWPEIVG